MSLNSTEEIGFQNGGGISGFRLFTDEPVSTPPPNWSGTPAGGFTDNTIELEYTNYSMEEFLHGFTGSTTGTNNRGGVFAICAEIPPTPSIELVKSVTNVEDTNNNGRFGDAGDTVNYEFTVENTGNTALANISVDDTGFSALAGTAVLTQPASGFDGDLASSEGPVVAATATYIIDNSDVTAGSITNTATVTSTAVIADASGNPDPSTPIGGVAPVTDTSDTGSGPPIDNFGGTVPTIANPAGTGTGDDATVLALPTPPPSLNPAVPTSGPQACSAPIVPLPVSSTSLSWTGLSNSGGLFTTNTGGESIVPVTVGALTTVAPVTDDEVVQASGGGGTSFQFNNPTTTEAGAASANAWVFDHPVNLRVFTGPTFGGSTSAMDQDNDRLVFNATGTTPGFTWVVDGLVAPATQAVVSNGGTTLTISASASTRPRSFAEFDISTNGQLTGLTVQRDSIVATSTDNARFNIQVPICLEAELDVGKAASVGSLNPNGTVDVTYTITVQNSGDVQLDTLTLVDNLTAADQLGSTFRSVTIGPAVTLINTSGNSTAPTVNTAGYDGTNNLVLGTDGILAPGDSYEVTFTVNLDPFDNGQPATLDNTAVATAMDPSNVVVTDASDTNTAPDGTPDGTPNNPGETTGDPTVITLPVPAPSIALVKSVSDVVDTNGNGLFGDVGDVVNFEFTVENTGNTSLAGVSVTDTGIAGLSVVPATSFDGDLAIGEGPVVAGTAAYTLTPTDVATGSVTNTATTSSTAVATDASGNPDPATPLAGIAAVTDTSDAGSDPALDGTDGSVPDIADPASADTDGTPGNDGDEPTVLNLVQPQPEIQLTKFATQPTVLNGTDSTLTDVGDTITYTFTVRNMGNIQLTDVIVIDDNATISGGPIAAMEIGDVDTSTFTALRTITQADIDAGGIENSARVVASSALGINSVEDISDTGAGSEATSDPDLGNDANGTNDDDNDPTNDPTIIVLTPVTSSVAELVVTKTAGVPVTRVGEVISYTINVRNDLSVPRLNISIVDLLPNGLVYRPGSGLIDGVSFEPSVIGGRVIFVGQDIPANGSLTVTFNVGVATAGSGSEYVNRAFVEDPLTGTRISNIGTATVRREIEHVFDCSDIIGKVYDDRNRNGYQDDGEVGLPGVRVVTVNGLLITTDKHGRYNIPCAALPQHEIGENFILKLDTRTLPTGYRITTENPRVIRVTRGKLSKINFGASIGRVVKINVSAAAFVSGSVEPSAALENAFDGLIGKLDKEPSVLRLSYQASNGDEKLGRKRIRNIANLLQKRWRKSRGSYDLEIETRVVKK